GIQRERAGQSERMGYNLAVQLRGSPSYNSYSVAQALSLSLSLSLSFSLTSTAGVHCVSLTFAQPPVDTALLLYLSHSKTLSSLFLSLSSSLSPSLSPFIPLCLVL